MGIKDIQEMVNARNAEQSPMFTGSMAGVAAMVAARTPEYAAPKIDRKAVFAKLDLDVSSLTNDAIHGPNVVIPPPVRMISMMGSDRPATPEEIANGMGHDVAPKASPHDLFRKSVQNIMAAEDDPANKEKKIKSIQSAYKQKQYEAELLPVQTYWDNKLVEEHEAERHAQRVTGWIEAWQRSGWWGYTPVAPITTMWNKFRDDPEHGHRFKYVEDKWTQGEASLFSGVASIFGAKDYARAAYLATKAPELADAVDADWIDKALGTAASAAPYMIATTVASIATGGAAGMLGLSAAGWGAMGGGLVSFGVEGNSAYQNAIDAGVDEETARQIGFQTGLINAAIEAIPFGSGMKYIKMGKKAAPEVLKDTAQRILTTKMKAAGKWTKERAIQATQEALEEAGQELGTMLGETQFKDIKGKEVVDRVMAAGAGGFFLGGTMGMAMSAMTAEGAAKAEADVTVNEKEQALIEQAIANEKVRGPIRSSRFSTADAETARNEGIEATALYLRKAGVVDEGQIKLEVDTVRTLADDVKDDIITPAYAQKQLKAWGYGDKATPDQARVTARFMTDGAIKIFNGADSASVIHELGHNHFDTLDKASQKLIEAEVVKYEADNPDTTSASREPGVPLRHIKERYSDLVADYAVSTRIHKKVGVNLHKFLGAARDMWHHVLARVLNMRTNIAAGRMSNRLKEMLAAPLMAPEVAPIEPAGKFVQYTRQGPDEDIPRQATGPAVIPSGPSAPAQERAGKFVTAVPQGPDADPLPPVSPWNPALKPRQGPSYQMVAPPQGGAVTAPRARYVDDIATDSKNVWVRPIGGNYSIDNSKRTLLMQFSDPAAKDTPLYDFVGEPSWVVGMAKKFPDADLYIVRDPGEAKQFVEESGYQKITVNSSNTTPEQLAGLLDGFSGKVSQVDKVPIGKDYRFFGGEQQAAILFAPPLTKEQLDEAHAVYGLRPLEKKVAMKTAPVEMSEKIEQGFILSDGQVLPVGFKETHQDVAQLAGLSMEALIEEGSVRFRVAKNYAGTATEILVEAASPMTAGQRDALTSFLDMRFGKNAVIYFDSRSGDGESSSWMYDSIEKVDAILKDMDARLGKPVASYELRPAEQEFSDRYDGGRKLKPMDEAGFIMSNGKAVVFPQNEMTHGLVAGSPEERNALYAAGVIRFRRGTDESQFADAEPGELIIEAHLPMTYDQREAIKTYLDDNFGKIRRVIFDAAPHKRDGGTQSYAGDDDASDTVADMQQRLDSAHSQVAHFQLQRADTAPVSVDQKIQMGIIPELLGFKKEQAASHRQSLTGKADWSAMNYGEAKKVIADLLDRARAKGIRLNGEKTFADWLAVGIQQHATSHTDPINALRPGELASWWKRIKKGIRGWDVASTRIERLCMELGGYEKGSLYNAFFLKVREAADAGEVGAIAREQGFKSFMENTLGLARMKAVLSTKQEQVVPGKYLDPSEQMSFLMMAKNDHGMRRLTSPTGHNYSSPEVIQAIRWITINRPDVVVVADWMLAQYEEQFIRLDAAHFAATGEHLNKEDFYSPLYLRDVELEQQHDYLADLIGAVESQSNAPHISETIDREQKASQPVHMDAVENYLFNSRRVERYIALAPSVARSAKILNNRNFKAALNGATSGYGNVILGDWLRDTARGYAAEGQGLLDKTMRVLRRKSMAYVLGAKFTASTRQVLSLFKTIAVDPKLIPAIAQNLLLHPIWSSSYRKMEAEVFASSAMMKARSFDRIETQLKQSTSARKKLQGKTLWDEKMLWTLRTMDRHIAVISWKASFDVAKAQGMVDADAIKWADEVVRTTQSMGEAVDLPAFFRGGTLAKLLTTFENDNNQNYNYWRHDVFGQYKTGKIGVGGLSYRILMSYVIPALLMGMIGRGGTPEDMEDVATDLATFPLASIVLLGRWSYAAIKGYSQGSTIVDVPFTQAGKALQEVGKGNYGKAALEGAKAAAAFTGTVPQQAFTTTQGAIHLMTDEDNNANLRELLYTRSQLGLTKKSESGGEKKGKRR